MAKITTAEKMRLAKENAGKTKKQKTKKQKQKKKSSSPARFTSKGKLLLAVPLLVLGCILCSVSVNNLITKENVTADEEALLTDLRREVTGLQKDAQALPDVSDEIVSSVNVDTFVSQKMQDQLKSAAESSGMVVKKASAFEKRNEFDIVKAYYQIDGVSQISNIVEFLKKVQTLEQVILIEEVSLTEGARVSVGFDSLSDETSTVKEFRVVLVDAYPRGNIGEEGPENNDNARGSVASEPIVNSKADSEAEVPADVAHTHTFGEIGWVKLSSHADPGLQVQICKTCHEVLQIIPQEETLMHDWGEGECGARICLTCGEKEPAGGHLFSVWETASEPTCYLIGYEERACLNEHCTEKETRELPKTEHRWVLSNGAEACSICGTLKDSGIKIEMNT